MSDVVTVVIDNTNFTVNPVATNAVDTSYTLDLVIDGGPLLAEPSTVVDLSGSEPVLVRAGIDPSFSLEIAEFNSQRISVGGEVRSPALVPIGLVVLDKPAWEFVAVAGLCALIVRAKDEV